MGDLSGSRECHVIKKPSEEFEFFLKDDPNAGQVITSVTKDGPAYRAGLKDGDRVIAINGEKIGDKDHNTVVALIRDCIPKNEVKFIVIAKSNETAYKKKPSQAKQSTKTSSSQKKASTVIDAKPRICKIKKKNDSFGFFMAAQESKPGHFIKSVTKGGPADGTGLQDGDRIIAVGKTNVEKLSHAQVVATIKKSGSKCTLLVIDEEGYQEFQKRGIPITEKTAKSEGSTSSRKSTSSDKSKNSNKTKDTKPSVSSVLEESKSKHEGKVRVVHVVKPASKGYGFFLKSRKVTGEEYVDGVDKGGAADLCGLQNSDRVVAVNGKAIIGMSHEEVIGLIKEKQCQVIFVVFDETAGKLFKEKDDFPSKDDIVYTHKHKIRSAKLTKGDSGYGMYLKMEKGCPFHIFCDIEKGKPADQAGLEDGDILIGVEGEGVLTATHEDCVKKIKDAGDSCDMIVGGRKTAEFLHKLGVAVARKLLEEWPKEDELQVPSLGKVIKDIVEESDTPVATAVVAKQIYDNLKHKPRFCKIKRRDGGFGFFLKDDNGHYLTNVEEGGPAYEAGVLELDRIVEVNGKNVQEMTHNETVQLIRESEDEVTFLLVSKEEDAYFKENNILITAALLDAVIDDELDDSYKPRLCHLVRTETGFGFHLSGESDREGQFTKDIMAGGAADISGLKDGDRIIEVNGVNVMGESHDAVVKRIKERENEVTFLVADKECDEYYKRKKMIIVASMVAIKAISETEVERNQDERESLHSASAASSIIETEATVHKEDDKEIEVEDEGHAAVAVVAAAVVAHEIEEAKEEREETIEAVEDVVEEILEERQEEREEEAREQREELLEDLSKNAFVAEVIEEAIEQKEEDERKEEVIEAVKDSIEDAVEEAVEERQEEERLENVENIIKVAAAAEIVDEIREEREEDREEREEIREEIEEYREEIQEEREEVKEEIREEIEDVLEEQEEGREYATEILEDKISEQKRREEEIRKRVEEALEQYKREEAENKQKEMQEKLEDAVEDYVEEKKDESKPPAAMKVAQAMVLNEMMNKVENGSRSADSSESENDEAKETAKAVATAAVIAKAVREEKAPEPAAPAIPLAQILNQNQTPDKVIVKGQISEQKKTTPVWGRHVLKPVNKPPQKIETAPTPLSTPNDEEVTSSMTKSTVVLMREAIERRNREMNKARGSSVSDELADLRKRSGVAAKRMEMFGGSAKNSSTNGYGPPKPQKQTSWSGEGMTIKIVET